MKVKEPAISNFLWWFFRKERQFNSIAFLFLSRTNPVNKRYESLFFSAPNLRLVILYGIRLPYTDRIMLKVFEVLLRVSSIKLKQYNWVHRTSIVLSKPKSNEVLHIDDPTYSATERNRIRSWEKNIQDCGYKSKIFCTNSYTYKWLAQFVEHSKIRVIPQGFDKSFNANTSKFRNFACVYSSPFIHYGRDLHSSHSTWSATNLIDEILPEIAHRTHNLEVHLIGHVGPDAQKKLREYSFVILHGYLESAEYMNLVNRCHLGLYPRLYDHKRSVKKIYDYIGCGLPIVTFRLIDTDIVEKENLGVCVATNTQFVDAMMMLSKEPMLYERFVQNVIKCSMDYSWNVIAKKMIDYLD